MDKAISGVARTPIDMDLVYCHLNHTGEARMHAFLLAAFPDRYWHHICASPETFDFSYESEITFTIDLVSRIQPRPMRAFGLNALVTPDHVGPTRSDPVYVTTYRDPIERLCVEFEAYRVRVMNAKGAPSWMHRAALDISRYADALGRHNLYCRFFAQVDAPRAMTDNDVARARAAMQRFEVVHLDDMPGLDADRLLQLLPPENRNAGAAWLAGGGAGQQTDVEARGLKRARQLSSEERGQLMARNEADLALVRGALAA